MPPTTSFHTLPTELLLAVMGRLGIPDVLRLALLSKATRCLVVAAWRQRPGSPALRALVVASQDNRLLLLNSLTGKGGGF